MRYFCILGNNKELSFAELYSVFFAYSSESHVIKWQDNVVLFDSSLQQDVLVKLFHSLGGCVKLGLLLHESDGLDFSFVVKEKLLLAEKVYFGVSRYGIDRNITSRVYREADWLIRKNASQTKKALKAEGKKVRWVTSKKPILSSVIVQKEKLLNLNEGIEIVVFLQENLYLYGRTLAVQDYETFSKRDYGRPGRDATSGMLPPKLARMMIHISGIKKGMNLLDPFCGSGTILAEASLLHIPEVFCSDISSRAVEDSKKNFQWLLCQDNFIQTKAHIMKVDVAQLSHSMESGSIDRIVTEPYLGPPMTLHKVKRIDTIISELSDLYLRALKQFYFILKKKGKVVIVFPVFYFNNTLRFLPILQKIESMGFRIDEIIPSEFMCSHGQGSGREKSLSYYRDDQIVRREIWRFSKK